MGRKTNSVSLRLQKTNRDYNNCWYGDILYRENFTKSLKIGKYLSQTLNTIGVPGPQVSVIGAFKKANLLICYLDAKKRKRLLEKSSRAFTRAPQVLQASRNGIVTRSELARTTKGNTYNPLSRAQSYKENAKLTKLSGGLFSLAYKKQEKSKLVCSSLNSSRASKSILENNFSFNSSLQCKGSFLGQISSRVNLEYEASILEREKGSDHLNSLKGLTFMERDFFGGVKHIIKSSKVEKKGFNVENIKGNNQISKTREVFCYQGTIGLEFLQSNQYQALHGLKTKKMMALEIERFSEQLCPFFFGSKKQRKTHSVGKFRPFSFPFFFDEKIQTTLISAFSKNFKIFRKKAHIDCASTFECFLLGSRFVYNHRNCNVTQKVLIDKQQFLKKEEKKTNPSLINLIGFYNSLARFWENTVSLSFYRSSNETCCALFLANTVSYLLEKKVLFRSIKRQILLELNQSKSFSTKQEKLSRASSVCLVNPSSELVSSKSTGVGHSPRLVLGFSKNIKTKTMLSKNLTAVGFSPCSSFFAFDNKKKVTGIRISCKGRVGGRSKKAQRSRKDTLMWGETGLHVFSSKLDFAKTHAETAFGVIGVQVWVCTK